ncbi:MAG: hypothetical protein IT430_03870 [Phycisphaerales bacterium]|nr:hypothetical protein [Phycisphaerales bacterium]
MWRTFAAVLVGLMLCGLARAQEPDADSGDRLEEISQVIADLEARIMSLEDENAVLRQAVEDLDRIVAELRSPAGATRRDITAEVKDHPTFRLEEVRKYDPAPERARLAEIDKRLTEIAESTEKTQRTLDANKRKKDVSSADTARLNSTLSSNRIEARRLQVEAARIQREVAVPRFWLMGWDGDNDVMLLTTRDEAELMRMVRQGDCLQWVGEVVEAGLIGAEAKPYETVIAKRVWRMENQAPIADRPKDHTAVWAPLIEKTASPKSTPLPHLPSGLRK